MKQFLKRLVKEYNLTVDPTGTGWKVTLPHQGEFICQLDIGPQTLDWYAAIFYQNDQNKIWMDWMDYDGYDEKTEDQLVNDKQRDISWFVISWITATAVRFSQESILCDRKKIAILEWNHSGEWDHVCLCDPTR